MKTIDEIEAKGWIAPDESELYWKLVEEKCKKADENYKGCKFPPFSRQHCYRGGWYLPSIYYWTAGKDHDRL